MTSDQDQRRTRKVVGKIPSRVWIVAVIGFAERFCFYGLTAPFQNYLQNRPGFKPPGVLGLGQSTSTAISTSFSLYINVMPLFGAILADNCLGCYKTLLVSFCVYLAAVITLVVTSLPSLMSHSTSLGGFISGMLLLGVGVGGVRATLNTFIGDQYEEPEIQTSELADGVIEVADRDLALQYIYSVYYWMINIGALSGFVTTFLERYVGFWAAFLIPLCLLIVGFLILIFGGSHYVKKTAEKNALPKAAKVLWCAARHGFSLDKVKPSSQNGPDSEELPWTDAYVVELKSGLMACRVFSGFAIAYLCFDQVNNNLISQAAQMETHGLPNDMFPLLINSLTVIVALPIIQKILYPWLNKNRISFGPILRMTVGFLLLAVSIAYAAGIQSIIYHSGPCYDWPRQCLVNGSDGVPNTPSVALQIPIFIIQALAEIFCVVTGTEYAYKKAPQTMKSIIQAIYICCGAGGGLLGIALSPIAHNPYLVILFSAIAATMTVTTALFWFAFRLQDQCDEQKASESPKPTYSQGDLEISLTETSKTS